MYDILVLSYTHAYSCQADLKEGSKYRTARQVSTVRYQGTAVPVRYRTVTRIKNTDSNVP